MKPSVFYSKLSSSKIRENIEKQFGSKVSLAKYTREELEDLRNKLRTRVFQQENSNGFNDLLTNETYQKDMAMLQLLNTRIKEMLGEDIKKLKDKMIELSEGKKGVKVAKHPQGSKKATKDYDGDGKVEAPKDEVWGSRAKAAAKAGKPFSEAAKPDFLDADKDGDKKEPMKKAIKDKKVKEETGKFDKTDTTWTDKSGKKHPAQRVTRKTDQLAGGTDDAPADKKAKKTQESKEECNHTPKGKKCPVHGLKECGTYEGKDEGKPGKNFAKIAKAAGGGEKGNRIAGKVRANLAKQGKLEESNFKQHVRLVNESLAYYIAEDEEGKAKAITAASDMVNDFTSWMQRVGQYQTKAIIELADAIKSDFGAAEAETFKQTVAPALAATLETLTSQREVISGAVAALAGEAPAEAPPMGMEPEVGPEEPGMDTAAPDEMNPEPAGDEFGAADAASAGREVRESKFARKLAESHSIMSKLAR